MIVRQEREHQVTKYGCKFLAFLVNGMDSEGSVYIADCFQIIDFNHAALAVCVQVVLMERSVSNG